MGVFNSNVVGTVAQALYQMGTPKAIVLHGREKLDEAGLADATDLALLSDGEVRLSTLNPQQLGLTPAPTGALRGGDVEENALILRNVLQGKGTQAQQDAVALNACVSTPSRRRLYHWKTTKQGLRLPEMSWIAVQPG
jgi:anthranilate phosphoribosyltransferase